MGWGREGRINGEHGEKRRTLKAFFKRKPYINLLLYKCPKYTHIHLYKKTLNRLTYYRKEINILPVHPILRPILANNPSTRDELSIFELLVKGSHRLPQIL